MEIIFFNGYSIDNLYSVNALIREKECEVCKYGIKDKCESSIPCGKSTQFEFSGIREIIIK